MGTEEKQIPEVEERGGGGGGGGGVELEETLDPIAGTAAQFAEIHERIGELRHKEGELEAELRNVQLHEALQEKFELEERLRELQKRLCSANPTVSSLLTEEPPKSEEIPHERLLAMLQQQTAQQLRQFSESLRSELLHRPETDPVITSQSASPSLPPPAGIFRFGASAVSQPTVSARPVQSPGLVANTAASQVPLFSTTVAANLPWRQGSLFPPLSAVSAELHANVPASLHPSLPPGLVSPGGLPPNPFLTSSPISAALPDLSHSSSGFFWGSSCRSRPAATSRSYHLCFAGSARACVHVIKLRFSESAVPAHF